MTSAPVRLGLGRRVEAEELAQGGDLRVGVLARRPPASAAAVGSCRMPARDRAGHRLDPLAVGVASRSLPAALVLGQDAATISSARSRSAATVGSTSSEPSQRSKRASSAVDDAARPAAPRPRGRWRCGRRSSGRRRRRGRLTPVSSRQAGSMSRGTARSISSSGRSRARGHHQLELLALDDVVRRVGRGDDDVGALELRRAARRSGPRCRRSARPRPIARS